VITKRRRSSPVESKCSIALARRQLFDATRAPARAAPHVLLLPGEVLHGDPPQLALEHRGAAVRIGA